MTPPAPPVHRAFQPTATGLLHVASCGTGLPVLLLHQTPRSWDEFRDVLPLLGARVRALAMDTPGFGDSPARPHPSPRPSIESWAAAALSLLDALHLPRAAVVGHHTGAAVAMELAVQAPARVAALVLSSCPFVDAARRRHAGRDPIDTAPPAPDGSHLVRLWRQRRPFYPPGTDLLDRFVVDALRAGPMAAEGHRVVDRYRMEDRIALVRAPTLLIAAPDDPHAFPNTPRLAAALPGATVAEIPGGTVPLPDALPAPFAAAILAFLERTGLLP